LAVALELAALKEKLTARRLAISSVMTGVLALWFVFLGSRTFVRTFDWKNQRTFLERTIAHGGDSARMLINLAELELTEGKLEAVERYARNAWAFYASGQSARASAGL